MLKIVLNKLCSFCTAETFNSLKPGTWISTYSAWSCLPGVHSQVSASSFWLTKLKGLKVFLFGVVSLTDFSASSLREPLRLLQLSGLCVCFVDCLQVVANRRAPGVGQVREALHCWEPNVFVQFLQWVALFCFLRPSEWMYISLSPSYFTSMLYTLVHWLVWKELMSYKSPRVLLDGGLWPRNMTWRRALAVLLVGLLVCFSCD